MEIVAKGTDILLQVSAFRKFCFYKMSCIYHSPGGGLLFNVAYNPFNDDGIAILTIRLTQYHSNLTYHELRVNWFEFTRKVLNDIDSLCSTSKVKYKHALSFTIQQMLTKFNCGY